MRRDKVVLVLFSTILVFLWLLPEGMLAQDVNRVALVVRMSEQSVQTACVEFAEPEVSGLDILQHSGFDFAIDVQSMGAKVCSIEQMGCPADDCWCQCKGGGDCIYWSYWHQSSGQWEYAQGGASMWTVRDGDVEGWSWGPGAVNAAYPPPSVSFEDVCTSSVVEDATATPTATATATAIHFVPADTPVSEATQSQPTATATNTPMPTSTIPATATISTTAAAVPTSTVIPTTVPTAVPLATEISPNTQAALEPTGTVIATVAKPLAAVDRELKPTTTIEPSPMPSPTPVGNEINQTAPDTAVALAVVGGSMPTRPGEQETKKLAGMTAEPPQNLTVIGSEAQVSDLRALPLAPESQIATMEDEKRSNSLFSYMVFGLIVLGLFGLLAISSTRRRERLNTFVE